MSMVQNSHYILHRLHRKQNTFHLEPSYSLKCVFFTITDTTTRYPTRISPKECRGTWHVSQVPRNHQQNPAQMLPDKLASRSVTDSSPSKAGWAHSSAVDCQSQVGTNSHSEPSGCSVSKVTRYLATKDDQMGWGRGSQV